MALFNRCTHIYKKMKTVIQQERLFIQLQNTTEQQKEDHNRKIGALCVYTLFYRFFSSLPKIHNNSLQMCKIVGMEDPKEYYVGNF